MIHYGLAERGDALGDLGRSLPNEFDHATMLHNSKLTRSQERLLARWRLFAKLAFAVSLAALIPAIGALLVPHTGWPLFGFIFYATLLPLRIVTSGTEQGYASGRNYVSVGLVIVAVHGIAQLMINGDSRFEYNLWLAVSPIQPFITIGLPMLWLAAFWLMSTKNHGAMSVEHLPTNPANNPMDRSGGPSAS